LKAHSKIVDENTNNL